MKRPAVRIDPARAAALIELPDVFHPLLAEKLTREKMRCEREKAEPLPERGWGPFATAIGRRDLRIQDAILKAADTRGHVICHGESALSAIWLVIDGERVDWEFRERYFYRTPRNEEAAPGKNWQGRQRRNIAEPTGYLILSVKAALSPKQDLHERHGHLFENRIDEILDKFEARAAHAIAQRNRWEESDRARREREERELRRQTLEEREDERWTGLRRMAAAWRDADNLRAFVDLVAARMDELDARPARADLWLDWARRRIDALDPSRRDARAVYETVVQNPLLRDGGTLLDNAAFDEL